MDAPEWQNRLQEAFGDDALVGSTLVPIVLAEERYGMAVAAVLPGFSTLSNSFQSFYVETLRALKPSAAPKGAKWYWPLAFMHISIFRVFRSAEALLLEGYPLIGYSLLREVKDRAFVFSAVARHLVSLRQACGWEAELGPSASYGQAEYEQTVLARKKIEGKILKETIGTTSGFDKQAQADLKSWNQLFHAEVHGSHLSFAVDLKTWLKNPGPLPVANELFHQTSVAMLVNRFEEAAWFILRTLAVLQTQVGSFGPEWSRKWHVLDDALRATVAERPGKAREFADRIFQLVEQKFPFVPENTAYSEPADKPQTA
jgi:hypothetical protein